MNLNFNTNIFALEGSLSFVKTTIRITVCNILSNRIKYGEGNFVDFSEGKFNYIMLLKQCTDRSLNTHFICIEDLMKDIDTQNMNRIFLLIQCKETDAILEQYSIIINYPDNSEKIFGDRTRIKSQTFDLLRNFKILRRYDAYRVEDVRVSIRAIMKTEYEEDSSIPMYFIKCQGSETTADQYECAFFKDLGRIVTNHHMLSILGIGKTTELKKETVAKTSGKGKRKRNIKKREEPKPKISTPCLILELIDADETDVVLEEELVE